MKDRSSTSQGEQAADGRKVSTGAVTRNDDPIGIAAELSCMPRRPLQSRVAVFEPGREPVLGCEAIVDIDDDVPRTICETAPDVLDRVDASAYPAAPVEVEQDRKVCSLGQIEARRNFAAWAGDRDMACLYPAFGDVPVRVAHQPTHQLHREAIRNESQQRRAHDSSAGRDALHLLAHLRVWLAAVHTERPGSDLDTGH
jgi:hypothetical protein